MDQNLKGSIAQALVIGLGEAAARKRNLRLC